MKKLTKLLSLCLLTGVMAAGGAAAGCSHKHSYDSEWSKDANNHWHQATCDHGDEKGDFGAHEFGDDDICDICEYDRSVKVAVESITIDQTAVSIVKGKTLTLEATVHPENATNKNRTWESSDETVATVNNNVVTAVGLGTAIITVTTEDGEKTATCVVTVTPETVAVESVSLNYSTLSLVKGTGRNLTATVYPLNASNKNRTWKSDNEEVATVAANGAVTAHKEGTATITVTTEDGGKTATCVVTVTDGVIHVTGVSLDRESASIAAGNSLKLIAEISPSNATDVSRTWSSSDNDIASVSQEGVVTAHKAGTATITVTTVDGNISATCEVTVTDGVVHVSGISINPQTLTLEEGSSRPLTATITPADANNKNRTWTSDNEEVATVAPNGTVTAHKEGTATITVTTEDGGKTATCVVTVTKKSGSSETVAVTGVTLDHTVLSLVQGTTGRLKATVIPSNATNQNVTYSSDNPSVATVTNDGNIVNAVGVGEATITVTTADGGKSATCKVIVTDGKVAVTGVTLNKETMSLVVGTTGDLVATILPENATNQGRTYSSSNPAVAKVEGNVVTAVSVGEAIITVTTEDGGHTAECKVTVTAKEIHVESIKLDQTTLTLEEGTTGRLKVILTPEVVTNPNVIYSSSDETVVKMEANVVNALKAGKAIITVTTVDGGLTAMCEVTVTAKEIHVESVSIAQGSFTMIQGNTATLRAIVTPAEANQNVSWTSSNPDVIKMKGNVATAVGIGTATITVTTEDGGKIATCTITVTKKYVPGDGKMTEEQFKAAIQATLDAERFTYGKDGENVKVDATNKIFIVAGGRYALYDEATKQIFKYSPLADIAWEKETMYSDIASFDAAKEKLTDDLYETLKTFLNADFSTIVYEEDTGKYTLGDTYVTIDDGKVFTFAASGHTEKTLSGFGAEIAVPENMSLVFENVLVTKIAKNETSGEKLPVMTGSSIYGLYAKDAAADNYVSATASGYNQTTKQGGTGLETYISFANLEGDIDGYFELSASAFGTKWDIIQFISSGLKKFCVNIVDKNGAAKYNLGASNAIADQKAPLTSTTIGANTKVRYTLKKAAGGNYKLTLTINGNPFVTDLDIGTDTVDRISLPASNVSKAPRNITVNNVIICGTPKAGAAKPVQSIELDKYDLRIEQIGSQETLTATITPADAADKNIKWASSDTSVATVSASGVVTAVAKGTAIITATAANGKSVSCTVNVGPKPQAMYTVSFISEGKAVDTQTVEKGGCALEPTGVKKVGYILQGWYRDEEGTTPYDFSEPVEGSLTLYAVWKINEELMVPDPVIPVADNIEIIRAAADQEAAYVEWKAKTNEAAWFDVYSKIEGGSYVKLDNELIRQYEGGYYRADAVGIKGGTYSLKIVPTDTNGNEIGASLEVTNLVVKAHERTGYGFAGGNIPGAYNLDGTLKSDAEVIYVTADTASSVTTTVNKKGKPASFTGFQSIIDARQGSGDTKPLCFRIVGTVDKSDLDHISSSSEGLQIKGTENITIEGIGEDGTIFNFGMLIRACKNVEVRNLGILNFMDDGISVDTDNQYLWVHNCDFFYGNPGGDSDQAKGDGSLDTKSSTNVTYSYNHFWDSGKSNLQGMTSDTTDYRMTYHHNWYDHSDSRHPRIRAASVHVYNNYFDGIAKYGVGVTMGASAFVENNYFRSTAPLRPMMSSGQGTDAQGDGTFSGEAGGMIKSFGNVYDCLKENLKLLTQKDTTPDDIDCYEASSRDEQVPGTYKTKSGGTTYNNFDTKSDFYKYKVQSAEDAQVTVMLYAGRVGGGDLKFDFDDEVQDPNYSVIPELKSMVVNYKSKLVKVGR